MTAAVLSLAGALFALWLLSLRLEDSSIIDIFWGLGFVVVAWLELRAPSPRSVLTAGLVTAWGVRLSAYLLWRNWGRGEDPRYTAMRHRHGARWPLRSLFIVFGLQGVLLLLVSMPVHAVMLLPPTPLNALDVVGALVCVTGIVFESVGDWQLARFKSRPENRGQVMQTGLWRFTRHPNYFGDFLVWWGLYLIAAATLWGALSVPGPLIMSWLLMRFSGVPMLERAMKARPGYEEYVRRTSAFFPRPPRG